MKGFTFIELLIVLCITVILVIVAWARYTEHQNQGNYDTYTERTCN